MICKTAINQLDAYLDGELSSTEVLALRIHLDSCPECSQELQTVRIIKSEVTNLERALPYAGFEDDLLKFVKVESARRPAKRRRHLRVAAAFALGAVLLSAYGYRFQTSQRALAEQRAEKQFDLACDQAYAAGEDPLSASPFLMPASYEK